MPRKLEWASCFRALRFGGVLLATMVRPSGAGEANRYEQRITSTSACAMHYEHNEGTYCLGRVLVIAAHSQINDVRVRRLRLRRSRFDYRDICPSLLNAISSLPFSSGNPSHPTRRQRPSHWDRLDRLHVLNLVRVEVVDVDDLRPSGLLTVCHRVRALGEVAMGSNACMRKKNRVEVETKCCGITRLELGRRQQRLEDPVRPRAEYARTREC